MLIWSAISSLKLSNVCPIEFVTFALWVLVANSDWLTGLVLFSNSCDEGLETIALDASIFDNLANIPWVTLSNVEEAIWSDESKYSVTAFWDTLLS